MKFSFNGYNRYRPIFSRLRNVVMIAAKSSSTRQKHEIVREYLTQSLRSGEFEVGRRLPADKELAARLGVSYMTARKAVNELVEASFLERRIGDGTYVRAGTQERLLSTTLNLICTAYEGATTKAFLQLGGVAAQKRGWRSHVIRIHTDHEQGALRALQNGELSLVLADEASLKGPLGKAMRGARGRAILLGWRLDESGVPSVLADDAQAVHLAVEHLQAAGHRAIALLCNHPQSPNERVQIAAWSEHLTDSASASERERLLIVANTPRFECASRFAYEATQRWLGTSGRADGVTALISIGDELAVGALAACRDAGRDVPEKMSLVNLNDSAAMEFSNPRVTCVDIDLESHIEAALEMLTAIALGETIPAPLRLIQPCLIERESVRPLVKTQPKVPSLHSR